MQATAKGRFNNQGFKGKPAAGNFGGPKGEKKESTPTTHYMIVAKEKGEEMEFVPGVFIRETPFGFSISITEGINPGTYFVNKKKDKSVQAG